MEGEEVSNKQIILKDYVIGFPKESDMILKTSTIKLKVSEGSNAVLLKNLYLSCDPYMRSRMRKMEGSYVESFYPGWPITGYGVAKVVDSGLPNFKKRCLGLGNDWMGRVQSHFKSSAELSSTALELCSSLPGTYCL
ncbi:unnamed protein product [Ilex paraguariensis]|uniref:Oxidoreductase N-terminal domain-containing protein n=1 Tax=Ilex paraguariensis TaxID=185542 RepID=A0ABC8TPW2_9AQUA